MATIRPGVLEKNVKDENRQGRIINVPIKINDKDLKARTIKVIQEKLKQAELDAAKIVVAGGWGLRSPEDFRLLEKLAHILGGMVGGTRPLVDKGWISDEQMIGQSGKTVRPKLYIGIGISGAMHHIVGIKDSEIIVSINNDSQAPILNHSDFCILEDLRKVLPPLIEELEKRLRSN
jgi:electron transfer flavoprotein alpha subunit